jgi:hypothetical protein
MAPPLKDIDPEQVKKLAAIQCSYDEMAGVLGCSPDTLQRRYAAIIKEGREQGRMSLKRKQYEIAMSGNVTMLIWLGKIVLDQIEKKEVQIKTDHDEELKAKVKAVPIASLIKLAKGA